MRKDVMVRASIDPEAAKLLDELAQRESEGNKSLMLRRVIREAGASRGLWVDPRYRGRTAAASAGEGASV